MRFGKAHVLLYAVTDRRWLAGAPLADAVEAALRGGATMVQLREKHASDADVLAEAQGLQQLCHRYDVPLIINDRVAVAKACGSAGVHIGQGDMALQTARAQLGLDAIIGVSVKTLDQALEAEAAGASYLGVGAVFPTGTKQDTEQVTHQTLHAICRAVRIPVCAIGGITEQNLHDLSGTGLDGVAVVSAIFAAEDVEKATRELRSLAEETVRAPNSG